MAPWTDEAPLRLALMTRFAGEGERLVVGGRPTFYVYTSSSYVCCIGVAIVHAGEQSILFLSSKSSALVFMEPAFVCQQTKKKSQLSGCVPPI
jgi:hypothetical protein